MDTAAVFGARRSIGIFDPTVNGVEATGNLRPDGY
jgi:hypothetical protein